MHLFSTYLASRVLIRGFFSHLNPKYMLKQTHFDRSLLHASYWTTISSWLPIANPYTQGILQWVLEYIHSSVRSFGDRLLTILDKIEMVNEAFARSIHRFTCVGQRTGYYTSMEISIAAIESDPFVFRSRSRFFSESDLSYFCNHYAK